MTKPKRPWLWPTVATAMFLTKVVAFAAALYVALNHAPAIDGPANDQHATAPTKDTP